MKNFEVYCSTLSDEEKLFVERRDSQYRETDVEKARIIKLRNLMKAVAATLLFVGNKAGRSYATVRNSIDRAYLKTITKSQFIILLLSPSTD